MPFSDDIVNDVTRAAEQVNANLYMRVHNGIVKARTQNKPAPKAVVLSQDEEFSFSLIYPGAIQSGTRIFGVILLTRDMLI